MARTLNYVIVGVKEGLRHTVNTGETVAALLLSVGALGVPSTVPSAALPLRNMLAALSS
jgi:hypothetical protein